MILLLILLTTVSYAIATTLISRASLQMNSVLAGAIVNAVGAILPFGAYWLTRGNSNDASSRAVYLALLAGVAIAVFTLSLTKVFAMGGNLSYVTPLVYGGTIVITSVIGYGIFKEKIVPLQLAGIALVAAGIGCIMFAKTRGVA